TLWEAFAATAGGLGDRPAVVEGSERLGFGALAARAEAVAGGLAALGVAPGDAVALQLPNWWETLVVLLAATRVGATAVPILSIHREREVAFILRQTAARAIFIPRRYPPCDHPH